MARFYSMVQGEYGGETDKARKECIKIKEMNANYNTGPGPLHLNPYLIQVFRELEELS